MADDLLIPETAYHAPATVAEAIALLDGSDGDAKILAGGQSLLVFKRLGLVSPAALVSLQRIEALRRIEERPDGGLSIGAMVTQRTVETSPLIADRFPALSEAAACVATQAVRQRGTIGGNLCHADPTGDPPAALIAYGATVRIAGPGGERQLPVEALFSDYMETALAPNEILVAVDLPAQPAGTGSAYLKHRLRGVDTALVGAGVAIARAGDRCEHVRIGVVGAGPTPFRAAAAEQSLIGKTIDDAAITDAARAAAAEANPLADTEGSEWYRREMVAVFVRRALTAALARAGR